LVNFLSGILINDTANKLPAIVSQREEKQALDKVIAYYAETKGVQIDINTLMDDKEQYEKFLKKATREWVASKRVNGEWIPGKRLMNQVTYRELQNCFDDLPYFLPSNLFLDRGEHLDAEREKRWLSNNQKAPSITIFSVFKEGSEYFHGEGLVRTKLEGKGLPYPIVNPSEGEILIPGGETIIYEKTDDGTYFASIIRSPALIKPDSLLSSIALKEAYKKHLSKPYKDLQLTASVEEQTIQRPNHGLAHTYRVMENIAIIINYFAHHAEDENFRLFCQNISHDDLEYLKVCAAFSVTGRESEVAFGEDAKKYEAFRQASAKNFEAFAATHPFGLLNTPEVKSRLSHVIEHMGNPNYEKDNKEDALAIYMHRILNAAHKLDLPRCYGHTEFESKGLDYYKDLSAHSDEQAAALQQVTQYSIEMIKAHGNVLRTGIGASGELVDLDPIQGYQTPFQEVSCSLQRLYDVSDTVPYPELTEAYQFHCEKFNDYKASYQKKTGAAAGDDADNEPDITHSN
jgi:hypothetical protein